MGGDSSFPGCPDGAGGGLGTLVLDPSRKAEGAECKGKKPHLAYVNVTCCSPVQPGVAEDSGKWHLQEPEWVLLKVIQLALLRNHIFLNVQVISF